MAASRQNQTHSQRALDRIVADVKDHDIFKIRSTLIPLAASSSNLYSLFEPLDRAFGGKLGEAIQNIEKLKLSPDQKAIAASRAKYWASFDDQNISPSDNSSSHLARVTARVFSIHDTHSLSPKAALGHVMGAMSRSQQLFVRLKFDVISFFRYIRAQLPRSPLVENLLLIMSNTKMDIEWFRSASSVECSVAYINDISPAQLFFVLSHLKRFVRSTSMPQEIKTAEEKVEGTDPLRFLHPFQIQWLQKYKNAPPRPPGRVLDVPAPPSTPRRPQTNQRPAPSAGNTRPPTRPSRPTTALTTIPPVALPEIVRESPTQETSSVPQRSIHVQTTAPTPRPVSFPSPSKPTYREGSLERLETQLRSSHKQYAERLDQTIEEQETTVALSKRKIAELTPKKRHAEREVKDLKAKLKKAEALRDETRVQLANQKLESNEQTKELWMYKEKKRKLDAGLSLPNH